MRWHGNHHIGRSRLHNPADMFTMRVRDVDNGRRALQCRDDDAAQQTIDQSAATDHFPDDECLGINIVLQDDDVGPAHEQRHKGRQEERARDDEQRVALA